MGFTDEVQKLVADITLNHRKYVDIWARAAFSVNYEEIGSVSPFDYRLVSEFKGNVYTTRWERKSNWRPIDTIPTDKRVLVDAKLDGGGGGCIESSGRYAVIAVKYYGELTIESTGCGCCDSEIVKAYGWMPIPQVLKMDQ